jgi:hypothetical protein
MLAAGDEIIPAPWKVAQGYQKESTAKFTAGTRMLVIFVVVRRLMVKVAGVTIAVNGISLVEE